MGVKGLISLLEGNSQIYQDISFRDSKLVVDGGNLLYHLYNKYNLDQNHGGEYLAFQALIQDFFMNLEKCGIKPYVVIDGGLGTSDIKLKTRMERQEGLLQNIPKALNGKSMGIFPPFTFSVFEQTLSQMKVPLVKVFGEADCQLAALASEWRCPVLSTDSDFYIYDLPGGLLSLDHFQWKKVVTSQAGSYIPCKRYTTSSFCTFFNIDHQLLPLFASLAGNDYVNLREMNWARFLPKGSPRKTRKIANLEGLLRWLGSRTDKTTEDTLTAAMALIPDMSQQEKTEVQTEVQRAMLEYQIPSSSLLGFFSGGPAPPLPAEMLSCVPEWFRASLTRGELGADVLDYDMLVRKILRIQVEHSDLESSNLISQPIRQVLYGLLLGRGGGGGVEEWDRVGLELVRVMVQPVVQGAAKKLRLDSLPQADHAVRMQVCLETLGVEEEMLKGVPAHLRLPVAVTCYWLRRAGPEPTLLKALLMVMVQGELNRQKGGTTGWQGDTNHITQSMDCVMAHSLNQWQACMKDASQLNQLLCMPLPKPHFAWLYQGRLVHQLQKQLQESEPEEILQDVEFMSLYRSLLEAVIQPDPKANRRSGEPEAQLTASMDHLHLNPLDEEEEELGGAKGLDQGLDRPRVSVKTRYRTKDRKDQSRNPELGRKQEKGGWQ
ncbi:unnamed protein product [Lota lota]